MIPKNFVKPVTVVKQEEKVEPDEDSERPAVVDTKIEPRVTRGANREPA